jgi:hypothetical protein
MVHIYDVGLVVFVEETVEFVFFGQLLIKIKAKW